MGGTDRKIFSSASQYNGRFFQKLGTPFGNISSHHTTDTKAQKTSMTKNIPLLYNGHLLAVCPEKNKKTPVSEKAGGVEKRLILSFKRIASTAGVRTHSDFGIVPSPYTVDFDNEIDGEIMMKVHFILFR